MDVKEKEQPDFRLMAEKAAVGMALMDESLRFIYVNPHMLDVLGYDSDELVGVSCEDISHPEDLDEIRKTFNALENHNSGSMSVKKRYRCKNGEYLWTRYTISMAGKMGEHSETYIGIMEKPGLASMPDTAFRTVFQDLPDMIFITDRENKLIDFNTSFVSSSGYDQAELVGKKLKYFFAEESQSALNAMLESIEHKGERQKEELRFRTKKETSLHLQITMIPQHNDGVFNSAWSIARDLTDIRKGSIEMNSINKQLIEKNRELEQIVYVTSHDLRSPLVNIQGFNQELEISMQDLKKVLGSMSLPEKYASEIEYIIDTEMPESIDYINSGIYKMDRLLKGLLTISRLGRLQLEKEVLDMNALVLELTKSYEYQLKENGIKLQCEQLPPCRADESQILQVFSNLIDNSIRYMREDVAGEIRIFGEASNSGVKYVVSDNGKGIPEDKRERVFEIFYRDEQSESGEGLGLTIVRKVIEKHLGDVTIDAGEDHGTIVSFTIPN